MRNCILACFVTLSSLSALAQTSPVPSKLVHFPHYVAIGPAAYAMNTPSGYYLAVEGGILTEHLRVATKNGNNWSDYVFAPSYRLTPLAEVERYIARHGHLPGIPSAQQVATQGIDVAQMQAKMMAKIEELTLHSIRQQKEITQLHQQLRRISAKVPSRP